MNRLEEFAEVFEVTCDYILDEFILDDNFCHPTMFVVETDGEIIIFDFSDDVEMSI